jgi:hypothetical protein
MVKDKRDTEEEGSDGIYDRAFYPFGQQDR